MLTCGLNLQLETLFIKQNDGIFIRTNYNVYLDSKLRGMIPLLIILLTPTLLIFYAVATDKELQFALLDGFMLGIIYDKEENNDENWHTIQLCLLFLSISVLWETENNE